MITTYTCRSLSTEGMILTLEEVLKTLKWHVILILLQTRFEILFI